MTENTPRVRIERSLQFGTLCMIREDLKESIRAILAANAGYERIIVEQQREAVREYKTKLANELRSQTDGKPSDGNQFPYIQGQDATLNRIADDLEDGTL